MTVYALDGLALYVGGREMTGFGEGGVIEITRESEEWENTKCTDGTIVSNKILDRSGMVTITTRYDSPANQILQRYAESRSSVTFQCRWPNGDYVHSEEARVQKYPDISDSNVVGDRQWQIFLADADYQFGVGA